MTIEKENHLGLAHVDDRSSRDIIQCLTFFMADVEYGVDILSVQEIRAWEPTTEVPNTPDYLVGVINIRGAIIPIVDLRKKFNLEYASYTPVTVVIVLKIMSSHKERIVGIVVDTVSDVYSIDLKELQDSPEVQASNTSNYFRGLISLENKMIVILDLNELLSDIDVIDE